MAPDENNTKHPTPDDEPPTEKEFASAVWRLVSYRKSRVPFVSHMAVVDGVNRGCLRWYYVTYPTKFERNSRNTLVPQEFRRRLVIERVYTSPEEGITNKWNEWCLEWDLPMMQVFTKSQETARLAQGLPIHFEEPHVEGEEAPVAADEVDAAIVAASEEFGLDLDAPAKPEPKPSKAERFMDVQSGEVDTSALQIAQEAMRRPHEAPAPPAEQPREKKFWEE